MEPFNETLCTLVVRAGQDHGVTHGVVTGDCSGTQRDTWSLSMKHCVHWSSEQARIMVLHMVLLQGTAQGRSVTHGAFQ